MIEILCLQEQVDQPALKVLAALAKTSAQSLSALARLDWQQPLVILGSALLTEEGKALARRAPHMAAPLLVMPPLPIGDMATLLEAAAPITVVRQRTDTLDITDGALHAIIGRTNLLVPCTGAIETALTSGILAKASGRPVIWAYQA